MVRQQIREGLCEGPGARSSVRWSRVTDVLLRGGRGAAAGPSRPIQERCDSAPERGCAARLSANPGVAGSSSLRPGTGSPPRIRGREAVSCPDQLPPTSPAHHEGARWEEGGGPAGAVVRCAHTANRANEVHHASPTPDGSRPHRDQIVMTHRPTATPPRSTGARRRAPSLRGPEPLTRLTPQPAQS